MIQYSAPKKIEDVTLHTNNCASGSNVTLMTGEDKTKEIDIPMVELREHNEIKLTYTPVTTRDEQTKAISSNELHIKSIDIKLKKIRKQPEKLAKKEDIEEALESYRKETERSKSAR